ncbi:hypothetical protein P3X46_002216 [Hevea brasiliensis]|uniref:Cytochrome P450 n=1 Tax=Hevea brasiliensis TaxID=3981 RepID=A0ABQ9N634_HEVBR|nr:cytochrome P450 CYP82D47-like [Hevea brasiliensis]KAJ9186670.1 hypothetical protein P3X46_002216 [Hevea brasiliensis]
MDYSLLHQYLSTILTAGVFFLLFNFYYRIKKAKVTKGQKAPEPASAWPIIGHLPLFATQLLHKKMGEIADEYGPIFTLRLGMHSAVVVSSWEMAKELFTANDMTVSSRPPMVAAEHLGYNYAMFGLAPYTAYWREIRKIATSELLSNRRLELLKHVRIYEVETSLKELYKLWTQRTNGLGQVKVELKQWLGDLNLNVILKMIAGKTYFGASAVDDEKVARRWQKAMREFFHYLGIFVVRDAVPFLGWLDLGGHEKAMRRTALELDSIIGEWLEEHKRNRASGEAREEQDFMDVMLSVLEDKSIAGYDADTINKATSLSLIAASSDTTTVAITWALSLLLNNQHALSKAQEELDICVGKKRLVNDADISKLVYLQAIVKETLRLYPPAPLIPRQFTDDCTIGGYHIPKGTALILNFWKIHTDPRVWPNPMEFKPERFLTTHKNIDVKGLNYELIPFGSGRRQCPGVSLGLQMVSLILASILHAFEISTPENAPIDMTESTGLTNMKDTPLEVILSPRLPPHIYA